MIWLLLASIKRIVADEDECISCCILAFGSLSSVKNLAQDMTCTAQKGIFDLMQPV